MINLRALAAALLLLSGVAHVAVIAGDPMTGTAAVVGGFGIVYFLIGLLLFRVEGRAELWAGVIVPAIGGTLGVLNAKPGSATTASLTMLAVDVVVPLICLWLLLRPAKS